MMVKVCPICEKRFEAADDELVYCSGECYERKNKKRRHPDEVQRNCDSLKAKRRKDRDEAERRRARLAKRDAEYAAHAPKVTVEEREFNDSELGMVIHRVETRGQPCIGFRAAAHVSHT